MKIPINKIIYDYNQGIGSYRIAKKYKFSKSFILKILKNNGIQRRQGCSAKHRTYKINFNFFEGVITEQQAYFLGLFCADGCNHIKDNVAEITLQKEDAKILEKLSRLIFINKRPLIKIKAKKYRNKKTGKTINIGECRRLSICSSEICSTLHNYGISERKTWSLKFPEIPDDLIDHFLRGYFDGDGGLSLTRKQNRFIVSLTIIGTLNICSNFQKILRRQGINSGIAHRKKDPKEVFVLYCTGSKQILKLLNFLYKRSTIHLERKFNLYKKIRKLRSHKYLYNLFEATNPKGDKFTRFNAQAFAKKKNLQPGHVFECIRGVRKSHKGWTFKKILAKIPVNKTGL